MGHRSSPVSRIAAADNPMHEWRACWRAAPWVPHLRRL